MNIIAILVLAAAPAAPSASQIDFDARCMIATQLASQQLEGTEALATQMASMYFFGRVDAVLSESELEERMAAAGRMIEGKPLGPYLQECGDYMQVRGKVMETIGGRLEAKEKARQLQ